MESPQHPDIRAPHYEIHTAASLVESRTHALKHGDTFALLDPHGDVLPVGNGEQGLYHEGTRYLSYLELRLQHRRPVLLGSDVRKDNSMLAVDATNPDWDGANGDALASGLVHLFRSSVVLSGSLYQHIRLRSFADRPVHCRLEIRLDADFKDMFEVRGMKRERRGERLPDEVQDGHLMLSYRGLDDVLRTTRCGFSPAPDSIDRRRARFDVHLEPKSEWAVELVVTAEGETPTPEPVAHRTALRMSQRDVGTEKGACCRITTSNNEFNAWLERTAKDLNLLLTRSGKEVYPYAGIPWYNTYFGRDGIITALMALWINPNIARGVLSFLARTQATRHDPDRVAEPGKILHEARTGEMAATGEVPFGRYYGTVDATLLFVMLAGQYLRFTADVAFMRELWPHIEQALDWIEESGDVDGDGFVEYVAHEDGLTQQGWKDSEDPIFHEDGTLATGPIALCEVQGYAYQARLQAAFIAEALGNEHFAAEQRRLAAQLRRAFSDAFWLEDLGTFALALDGRKQPCRVHTSNAGHALMTGIASQAQAECVARAFRSPDMFSGWGIRTVSRTEHRYNPMSYHNGSVWPHDNGLIAMGLADYGFKKDVHRIMKAFFQASLHDPNLRLPELFCGFDRRSEERPTPYPVACSPQAWATTTIYALLQASLGLSIDAFSNRVTFTHPTLPEFLEQLRIRGLRVGKHRVDLALQRHQGSVSVEIVSREGDIEVVSIV